MGAHEVDVPGRDELETCLTKVILDRELHEPLVRKLQASFVGTLHLAKLFLAGSNARSKRPRNAVRLTELLGGGATTLATPVNEAVMPAL